MSATLLMKLSIISIICLLFALSLGCVDKKAVLKLSDDLQSREWTFHDTYDDGSKYYYDKKSITSPGDNLIRLWTKHEFSKESSSYRNVKMTLVFLHDEIDCKNSTSRIIEGIGYLENGYKDAVIGSEPQQITEGPDKKIITLLCK